MLLSEHVREWCLAHSQHSDARDVVDYTLSYIVSTVVARSFSSHRWLFNCMLVHVFTAITVVDPHRKYFSSSWNCRRWKDSRWKRQPLWRWNHKTLLIWCWFFRVCHYRMCLPQNKLSWLTRTRPVDNYSRRYMWRSHAWKKRWYWSLLRHS